MELYIPLEVYIDSYKTKQSALFHALRDAIISGKLQMDWRLPSSRQLAQQYRLSRGTVHTVYEMLLAQGFLYTKGGSGTFVSSLPPQAKQGMEQQKAAPLSKWGQRVHGLFGTGAKLSASRTEAKTGRSVQQQDIIEFNIGQVELQQFPIKEWNRCLYEQARQQYQYEMRDAYSSEGHDELKQCIAKHVRSQRGIIADPDDIMIVNGSQQAITLLVQLLMDEGDYAVLEDPHYVGARHAVLSAGGKVHACPVDEQGICFHPKAHNYKLMLLTPSRQFPTGVVLSMKRRIELLQWAETSNAFIIEDDYDSEFRYVGRAIEPLKSLDTGDRVIYIGTFSRTMLQDIRIGYAILPKSLREAFRSAKRVYERHPISIIQQRALATFMATGQYDRHLRRLKRLYRRRAELVQQRVTELLGQVLKLYPTQSGLHFYAEWTKDETLFEQFLQTSVQAGVKVVDGRSYQLNVNQPAICIGFAHLSEEQIETGIARLHEAWEHVKMNGKVKGI